MNVTLEKCVKYVQKRKRIFKHNAFSYEFPAVVKAKDFDIRKTDFGVEEKRKTEITEKLFVNLCLLKVHSMRNKYCYLIDFDKFCMLETWL